MDSIFNYTDYREYLRDYYTHKKAEDSSFSYRSFLAKAGLAGPNFYREVAEGKKNLSRPSIEKFAFALELSKREAQYFTSLVLFNQAKTAAHKQKYFTELSTFERRSAVQKIQKSQYEYFSKWYNVAIREYIHSHRFDGNYEMLVDEIVPRISVRQAQLAVELLEQLGLVKKADDGYYTVTDPIISTGPEINHIGGYTYHKAMLDNSKKALDTFDAESRYFRSMAGSFSDAAYQKIKLELDNARKRILDIIAGDTDEKKVYHIGMQLFPLQRINKKRKDAL